MLKIFDLDAPIWVWMNEVADIIILSVMWWICCSGIITIGASTTAVFYVLGKKARKESTHIMADFFKSFKQNFKQSIPLSILYAIAGVSCIMYGNLILESMFNPENMSKLFFIVPLAIIMVFEFWNYGTYLWAILSRYEMKTKILCKTAFVMTHRHLLTTVGNTLLLGLSVYALILCPVLIVVAPGLIMLGQSYMMQRIFARYTTTE